MKGEGEHCCSPTIWEHGRILSEYTEYGVRNTEYGVENPDLPDAWRCVSNATRPTQRKAGKALTDATR